jgi:cytochrome c oxidase subunit 1
MVASQAIFVLNFFGSMFRGQIAGRNPWHSNGLEWTTPSPPGHGNFDYQPIVYRGPYEYGSPEVSEDYYPQIQPPPATHEKPSDPHHH